MRTDVGGRRAFLGMVGGLSAVALSGTTRWNPNGTHALSDSAAGITHGDCTPGHSEGHPACKQLKNDANVLTRFEAGETSVVTTFAYPCGWTVTTGAFDAGLQVNVTRSDIGSEGAYVDVQVRNYDEPPADGFLDAKKAEGDYDEVEYQYDGETRTGLVSSAATAQFGTVAHAVVPARWSDRLVRVELVSTLKGADCAQPQPDYGLVKDVLASLEPNWAATSVTFDDQLVADVETQAVTVASASLPRGGFLSVHEAPLQADDLAASVIGASRKVAAGTQENLRIALDTKLSEPTDVVAMVHRDTNDNNIYEFSSDTDVDAPYRNAQSEPVTDRARVRVKTPSPTGTPTRSPTPWGTGTETPTRTPTPWPSDRQSPTPTAGRESSATRTSTATEAPGFGVAAAIGGLSLGWLLALRRRFDDGTE